MGYSRSQDSIAYDIDDYVLYKNTQGAIKNGRVCTIRNERIVVLSDSLSYEDADEVIKVIKYEENRLILLVEIDGKITNILRKNTQNYNIEKFIYRSVKYTKSIKYFTKNNRKLVIYNDHLIAESSIIKLSDIKIYENVTSAGIEYYLKTGRGEYKLTKSSLNNKQLKLIRDSRIKGTQRTYGVDNKKARFLIENFFVDIYDIFDSSSYSYIVSPNGRISKTLLKGDLYKENYIKNNHSNQYIQIKDINDIQLSVDQFTYYEKTNSPMPFNSIAFKDKTDEYICIYLNNYHCTRELVYDTNHNTLRNKLLYGEKGLYRDTLYGFFPNCNVVWSGPLSHKGSFSGFAKVIQVDKNDGSIKIRMQDDKIKKVKSYLKHLSYTPNQKEILKNNEIKFLKDISYQRELLKKSYKREKEEENIELNNYIYYEDDLITGFNTNILSAYNNSPTVPDTYVAQSTTEPIPAPYSSFNNSNHNPHGEPVIAKPKPEKKTITYSSNKRLIIDGKQIPHLEYKKLDGKKAEYFNDCYEKVIEDKKELFIYHRGLVRVEPIVSLICIKEFILKNSQGKYIYVNQDDGIKKK